MSVEAPAPASASGLAPRCDNCGASVPGRYCGSCGQRLEPPVHSLGHFVGVAAEDLTHADSRLWRTLGTLLVKPGVLTREFLAGRRARYLPPVRLYLVVSVVFFLWAGVHASNDHQSIIEVKADGTHATVKDHASPEDCAGLAYQGTFAARVAPLLHQICVKAVKDNGRSLSEGLVHTLPRAMFVFLPALAAVMMLFYWRPRRYYVEHLLFLVHNHAFVFVFLMLTWVLALPIPPAFAALIWAPSSLYMVWYVYRAMRTVYGQGRALTIAKMLAMSFVYLVFGGLMLLITLAYSALTTTT